MLERALELQAGLSGVEITNDRLRAYLQEVGDFFQRPSFDTDPVQLPGFLGDGSVSVRMVAIHPEKFIGGDVMSLAIHLDPAATVEAKNQLVARVSLPLNAVLIAGAQMPAADH